MLVIRNHEGKRILVRFDGNPYLDTKWENASPDHVDRVSITYVGEENMLHKVGEEETPQYDHHEVSVIEQR